MNQLPTNKSDSWDNTLANLLNWKMVAAKLFIKMLQNRTKIVNYIGSIYSPIHLSSIFEILEKRSDIRKPTPLSHEIEGYLAPLSLFQGTIQDINMDWPRALDDYRENWEGSHWALPHCLTTIWNMWGPSYKHHLNNGKYEIYQFGYGDETNSIPVILDVKQLDKNKLNNMFVSPVRIKGTLIPVNDKRLQLAVGYETTEQLAERFSIILVAGQELNELLFCDSSVPDLRLLDKKNSDFYSAYVWARLRHLQHGPFYVFEHGNIANSDLLNQHIEMLAVKTNYFRKKFGSENLTIEACLFEGMREQLDA